MRSYMIELAQFLSKEQLQLVQDLFDWLIPPCLGKNNMIVNGSGNSGKKH